MRALLLLFVLTFSLLALLTASAHVFQIPVKQGLHAYVAEGLYRVYYLNGSPYFVLIANTNFTVFLPNGFDYVVGMGFLDVSSTPLGVVTLSKYYVYLNTTPVMQSEEGFVSGGANGDYIWAVLSNGSVMVWTPNKGYVTYVYGVPTGPLFFKNFSAYVNGSLNYLPVFYVRGLTFQEYFFTFISVPLGSNINLTEAKFYNVFTSYSVPVSFGFINGRPYFLGYNVTHGETVVFYSGSLKTFKGLPIALINYTVPAYLVHVEGNKYSVIFANGSSFNLTLSGSPSFFVYNKTIYIYGIIKNSSGNFTEVVQVFGPSRTFSVSSPLMTSFNGTSLIIKVLTPEGYVVALNVSLSSAMDLLGLAYNSLTSLWLMYLEYPHSTQVATVLITGSPAKAEIPNETFVYPNVKSDPLVYYGFKLPNGTVFLNISHNFNLPSNEPSSDLIFYAVIVILVTVVLVYAGVSLSRRKR